MKIKLQESGFSIVEVLVTIGLLGAAALGVMQLMKNIGQGQNFAKSSADEIELRTEIRLLLDEERFCRLSFAGNGPFGSPATPVTFQKTNIDENHEGLDVELWLGNAQGTARTNKKFSATDTSKNTYGKLRITSMKLIMNNGTGTNYPENPFLVDFGELRVTVEKSVSETQKRSVPMKFPIMMGLSTDSSGNTTIISCSRDTTPQLRAASGQNVVGPDSASNQAVVDLALYGFNPAGKDPHIIVSEHDYNYGDAEGNTMDASYCGFTKISKLVFQVTCWASTNSSSGSVQSSFDWMAIQN
ncbi:type IV pilus modification PilV family protein [Peredibacter starrii]|uniref:Prepilin-type N-terminal cleavage/methylation domain-containing protein n=1 Tax=Peredibacter starrii TaxID=28202 RepID=A0AAX4HPR5_9BACT|nr:hypothetical protein [Peredibacter starrii]WPU65192.1 hypothetical protein SOO65_00320 [Peredibacter starrii]